MATKDASQMAGLKSDQLRLLSELALFGGSQIVRHRRHLLNYEALAQRRLIGATAVSANEYRYNITTSGRTLLAAPTLKCEPRLPSVQCDATCVA